MMPVIEKRMYEDIHKIAISLGKIEHHLSVIAEAYTPVCFDFGETGEPEPPHSIDLSHVDNGK